MNIDNAQVGDIIPFLLTSHLDKAFQWRDIGYTNYWRVGQIVRIDGETLRFKDLLCDSHELESVDRSFLKKCLEKADNTKLVECMEVFAAQMAVAVGHAAKSPIVQDPVKIEVRENNNKVLELNENTRYIAVDGNCELCSDCGIQEKTMKEWEKFIAKQIEYVDDEFDAESLEFYVKVNLRVRTKKTIEVSIS